MKQQKAISLVEIVIVVAILMILMVIALGVFKPAAMVNRAQDAERKADLEKIKIAFEDYYNDKGCYPDYNQYVYKMFDKSYCDQDFFKPWLSKWPCDPDGEAYPIIVSAGNGSEDCPKLFKVMAKLENKSDPNLYNQGPMEEGFTEVANYSVSSPNYPNISPTVIADATSTPWLTDVNQPDKKP